jgi:hypothetical protein
MDLLCGRNNEARRLDVSPATDFVDVLWHQSIVIQSNPLFQSIPLESLSECVIECVSKSQTDIT